MRIALISFEFPPDTAYGGISSYTSETADMLARADHDVEVFCAGHSAGTRRLEGGALVHTVADLDKDRFAELVLPVFAARHQACRFDVAECAEIYGDGRAVKRKMPELPLVVKLHAPSFLCHRINDVPLTVATKLRFSLGALRRGRLAWLKPDLTVLAQRNQAESQLYYGADVVVSPSRELTRAVEAEWGIRPDGVGLLPNPFSPSPALLGVPPVQDPEPILIFGRLDILKGAPDFIEALALLEKAGHPVRANFVGAPFPSPTRGMLMDQWAAERIDMKSGRYRFTGPLTREQIPEEISRAGLVVLPSRWDNFPYTCLEAMAAGRAVIATASGGMGDMITDGVDGILVPPRSPQVLAETILKQLAQSERLAAMGATARQRVLSAYAPSAILPRQIEAYETAIQANLRRRSQ